MRTIAIVGGKLQATEACYLARHAGIRSTVIDIDPDAPARGMCDEFVCGNVIAEDPQVLDALNKADMVLPAMENDAVLEKLVQLSERDGFILAFDMDAYRISESKHRSDALFHRLGVPAPRYYPEGDFPFFAKEDGGSGSHGARRLDTQEEMDAARENAGKTFPDDVPADKLKAAIDGTEAVKDRPVKKWVCSVCGYVHEGTTPPELCPVCKVPASKFNAAE